MFLGMYGQKTTFAKKVLSDYPSRYPLFVKYQKSGFYINTIPAS